MAQKPPEPADTCADTGSDTEAMSHGGQIKIRKRDSLQKWRLFLFVLARNRNTILI